MLLFSPSEAPDEKPKLALAEKRLKIEIKELDDLPNVLLFPSPDDLFSFTITITAEEGYW